MGDCGTARTLLDGIPAGPGGPASPGQR